MPEQEGCRREGAHRSESGSWTISTWHSAIALGASVAPPPESVKATYGLETKEV